MRNLYKSLERSMNTHQPAFSPYPTSRRPRSASTVFGPNAIALACACALTFAPLATAPALAGNMDAEMQKMFNSLGVLGNVTAPGAYRGQTMNLYTGGELQIRAPIRNYQLWNLTLPSIKSGCGGVDAYLGSFSFINKAQFKAMLQQVGNNTVGLLFQAALASINPLIASKLEWLQNLTKDIGNFNRSSCQMANQVVNGMAGALDINANSTCIRLAQAVYGDDQQAAQERCKTNAPAVNADAKASADLDIKKIAGRNVNLVWDALSNTTLGKDEKEMFMNIAGTVVLWNALDNGGAARSPETYEPSVDNLITLLNGNDVGAVAGKVRISGWYTCPDADCLNPVNGAIDVTPFTTHARAVLESLRDKMFLANVAPTAAESGFIQTTTVPVYKMMAVGYMGSRGGDTTVVDTLISKYAPLIAYDYAHTFLNRALKDARNYMNAARQQSVVDTNEVKRHTDRIDSMLRAISDERALINARLPSGEAMVAELERTERNLRASLPISVRNMIDFSNLLTQGR